MIALSVAGLKVPGIKSRQRPPTCHNDLGLGGALGKELLTVAEPLYTCYFMGFYE